MLGSSGVLGKRTGAEGSSATGGGTVEEEGEIGAGGATALVSR